MIHCEMEHLQRVHELMRKPENLFFFLGIKQGM